MAVAAMDPFEYTATGILGDKRETMLHNELLLRNQLGRPMVRGYTGYPGFTYTYGRPNLVKDGGAQEAISGWSSNMASLTLKGGPNSEAPKTERDFMAMNRAAIQAGLTTANEQYQFRTTNDVRRKVQSEEGKKKMARRIPPTMVFGISTRPSTPVHDLLEYRYQDQWLQERRNHELSKRQKDDTKRLLPGKVYETRASLLRVHQVPVDPAQLWKMSRFTKTAHPQLETFRTSKERDAAFDHHQSDCISRRGTIGHGAYEQAKN